MNYKTIVQDTLTIEANTLLDAAKNINDKATNIKVTNVNDLSLLFIAI